MTTINKLTISIFTVLSLSGCMTARDLVSPERTLTEDSSKLDTDNESIKYSADTKKITLTSICSQTKSVHDPIMWLPVIGPIFDVASISNGTNLRWWEFPVSELVPLVGPAIVNLKGSRNCLYNSYVIQTDLPSYVPQDVDSNIINLAVALSNKNCSSYQNLVYGALGELGFTDTLLQKLAGTGATIAGVAGTAGGAAGLAAAGQLTSGSLDGIKSYFFQSSTLPNLFSTINTTRTQLKGSLNGTQKNDYWEYNDTNKTMPYGKFVEFINHLDNSCSLTQGSIDLNHAADIGNNNMARSNTSSTKSTNLEKRSDGTVTMEEVVKKAGEQADNASTSAMTSTSKIEVKDAANEVKKAAEEVKKAADIVEDAAAKNSEHGTVNPDLVDRYNLNGVPFK